jgi:hypothetical protein
MRHFVILLNATLLAAPIAAPILAQDAVMCTPRATPISGSTPATIPVDISNNHVFVKVCVGDRVLDFILDTGAPSSFFDLARAKEVGLRLDGGFQARGAGSGTVAGAQVKNGAVILAGSDLKQPISAAIDLSRLVPREAHHMDGILGFDFLNRFVVAIDYAKSELRLYDRDAYRYDGSGVSMPITFANNHPLVDAEVRLLDGTTIKGRMIVDVGSASSLSIAKPWVEEHHLRERVGPTLKRRAGGVGGQAANEVGRVASLRIGGLEVRNPTAILFGDSAGVFTERGPWVANIGGEVLRRFTLILDYKNKRMVFDPNDQLSSAFNADMFGAALIMDDSLATIHVETVFDGTPASEAGLQTGDAVIAVDGTRASLETLRDLRRRVRREGERVQLTVRRGGGEKTITVTTRRLI